MCWFRRAYRMQRGKGPRRSIQLCFVGRLLIWPPDSRNPRECTGAEPQQHRRPSKDIPIHVSGLYVVHPKRSGTGIRAVAAKASPIRAGRLPGGCPLRHRIKLMANGTLAYQPGAKDKGPSQPNSASTQPSNCSRIRYRNPVTGTTLTRVNRAMHHSNKATNANIRDAPNSRAKTSAIEKRCFMIFTI